MKRVAVDEIDALPVLDGALQWKPVRFTLGVDAFGINAYTGDNGALVVEEHADEHQELYLVVRGGARFLAADEEFDAPAGTFVLLEPSERRVAHATEDGTVVVAIGAEARRFEPSRWEYAFRGAGLAKLGRFDEAREAVGDGLDRYPDHPYLLYELACIETRAGESGRALELLRQAVAGDGRLAEHARQDPDLAAIRDDPAFASAVAGEPEPGGTGA